MRHVLLFTLVWRFAKGLMCGSEINTQAAGKRQMTAVPRFGLDDIETVPPCRAIKSFTIVRPRPCPDKVHSRRTFELGRLNLSTVYLGKPTLVSEKVRRRIPSSRATATVMAPPDPGNSSALLER